MEHLLALCGFEVEALYGWFDGQPFEDDSHEMVWIARKLQTSETIDSAYVSIQTNRMVRRFTSVDSFLTD